MSSLFSLESFKLHAESLGLNNLREDVIRLLRHDTEYRLREILQEATKYMRNSKRVKLTIDDINHALRAKHVEPIYGYDPVEPLQFKSITPSGLFYMADKEIDFDMILVSTLPRLPQPMSFTVHWLAIEGVQPQIPENPSLTEDRDLAMDKVEIEVDSQGNKYSVKHHLSKEHQIYFETVTSCVLSQNQLPIEQALNSLKADAGIQQLVPYFIQFITDTMTKNLRQLNMLKTLLDMGNALLGNPHLFIEPYLHLLMPMLLTCVVGKRLSESADEDHWVLREQASRSVTHICQKYGDAYPTLQPRVSKALLKALSNEKSTLPSKYGAFYCMSILGDESMELFVLPNIKKLHASIVNHDSRVPIEKIKCLRTLLAIVGRLIYIKEKESRQMLTVGETAVPDATKDEFVQFLHKSYQDCYDAFGDELVVYIDEFSGMPSE